LENHYSADLSRIVSTGIICATLNYNEFLFAFFFTSNPTRTLPIGVARKPWPEGPCPKESATGKRHANYFKYKSTDRDDRDSAEKFIARHEAEFEHG
jgi:hypothetical protein